MRLLLVWGLLLFASGCELFLRFDTPPEQGAQCSDGIDNDENGSTDCADSPAGPRTSASN